MKVLSDRYNIIALKDYAQARKDRLKKLPERALILTFDDGHKENYELLEAIKARQLPVTIFVCSSIIGTQRRFWFNMNNTGKSIQELKKLTERKRLELLKRGGFNQMEEFETRDALSDEELSEMRPFVDFQAHTRFHTNLPKADKELAREEIEGSKKELENKLGTEIYALAYPDGNYSDRDKQLLEEAGYQLGLSSDGYYNTMETDPFALKRLSLRDGSSVNEAIVRASGLWSFCHKLVFGQKYGYHTTTE